MVRISNTAKTSKYRIRYGVLLTSIAVAAGLVVLFDNDEQAVISRQATETIQKYVPADILQEISNSISSTQQQSKQVDHRACPLLHTSKLGVPEIVIDKTAIRAQSKDSLEQLKQFTEPSYEQYMMAEAGQEHYTLWHYLTKTYHSPQDCRHIVDIGTRYTASALALGATGIDVQTFDIPTSTERTHAFRGKPEEEWQRQLISQGVHMKFQNLDLLTISDDDFRAYMSTWLIIVDTFHLPYKVPFEREWLERLMNMEPKFEGIVMLDDIHLNPEMRMWWKEVQDNASQWGFVAHDVTSVGHVSGTGLLDFSGKVRIVE